ncbi:hypothetical protein HFO28_13730 [Rhizobium leguminosarum]|uniref:hypothetical protein n=1 Tax=Rhizobium leguminosarum TaxID=384 RepID=UPI001C966812|nr:hypothetical protein [Rhizobium leguminosarum]MBY5744644.1 hypothetical protein [Rhizobium leguminosarum]
MQSYRLFACLLLPTLAGCTAFSPKDVANPTTLTVSDALTDVGAGFANMKRQVDAGRIKLGLYPCKVTVNLNVTADAARGGTLVLDASTKPAETTTTTVTNSFSAHANLTQTNTSTAHRGNTVVVEMYSLACTPKDGVAGSNANLLALANAMNIAQKQAPVMAPIIVVPPAGAQALPPPKLPADPK